ncbi:hypothetical protein [Modestobacter sp. KNN46-3]|jgi:hypothetical protein|uniref:hypothetical protein n=1 Tax=Modestobacter sp. KNN46-3 TaxID=2711218 RepID=UPI0013DECBBD|nr:hypothetical protein [Modestobacter sp. KNN46-3]
MNIRRPVAALFVSLALVGGPALTACGDPAGLDRNDGTTDDSDNTGGSNPGGEDQGNLPDNSDGEGDVGGGVEDGS